MVGGMPRPVDLYAQRRQLPAIRPDQEAILRDYAFDIVKYAQGVDAAKVMRVWDTIPAQLSKENTKFQYGFVEKYGCPFGVILSRNNFGASERLHTVPLYAAFCVA